MGAHSRPPVSVSVITTEETLRELIAGGETSTVEFKIKAPRPAELAERICGMANTRLGGVIIFGVADTGRQIVGLKDPSASIDLALRAARMVKPAISFVGVGPTVQTVNGSFPRAKSSVFDTLTVLGYANTSIVSILWAHYPISSTKLPDF